MVRVHFKMLIISFFVNFNLVEKISVFTNFICVVKYLLGYSEANKTIDVYSRRSG